MPRAFLCWEEKVELEIIAQIRAGTPNLAICSQISLTCHLPDEAFIKWMLVWKKSGFNNWGGENINSVTDRSYMKNFPALTWNSAELIFPHLIQPSAQTPKALQNTPAGRNLLTIYLTLWFNDSEFPFPTPFNHSLLGFREGTRDQFTSLKCHLYAPGEKSPSAMATHLLVTTQPMYHLGHLQNPHLLRST